MASDPRSALLAQHSAVMTALTAVPRNAAHYSALDDDALLELARCTAEQQRLVTTNAALIAGEIARRSSPDHGSTGLAQRTGHRTAQELVRATTGSTKQEATTAVRVGQLAVEPALAPWLAPVGAALRSRAVSPAAAEAIRNGLGEPTAEITPAMLRDAATHLTALAPTMDADRLFILARQHRDAIDEAGIRDREAARHAARSLRFRRLPDGMAQLNWTLDPESAATVGELFDRATSPRRGGPRFVNRDDATLAEHIGDDTRTTEQLASDVFADLLRTGAGADSAQLLGSGAPAIRVLVAAADLDTHSGHGHIEGHTTPVSIETIERLTCDGTTSTITVDTNGHILDHGREQRLFTRQQRIALAARDGGCMWGDCDRPPSWTEAHHIRHWARDHGKTDLANGILLCRHHHLLLHNNGWEITRRGGAYHLIPPSHIDPQQRPRPMPTKSAAMREFISAS